MAPAQSKLWDHASDKALLLNLIDLGGPGAARWPNVSDAMQAQGYPFSKEACRQHFQKIRKENKKGSVQNPPPAPGSEDSSPARTSVVPQVRKPKGTGIRSLRKAAANKGKPKVHTYVNTTPKTYSTSGLDDDEHYYVEVHSDDEASSTPSKRKRGSGKKNDFVTTTQRFFSTNGKDNDEVIDEDVDDEEEEEVDPTPTKRKRGTVVKKEEDGGQTAPIFKIEGQGIEAKPLDLEREELYYDEEDPYV